MTKKPSKARGAIPKKNETSADLVMTPLETAQEIIKHFQPSGTFLDPCSGNNTFIDAMLECAGARVHHAAWCEISRGIDFFGYKSRHDWIVSNPPYSILRPWLQHSYEVADNIVYLVQQPRPDFKALLEDAERAGFGLKEKFRIKTPDEWRKSMSPFGGGYCAAHWQRGWDHSKHGTLITGRNS